MKIGLISMAYTSGGYTAKQFDSIIPNSQHEIIPFLFLHNDRSQELIEECEKLTEKYNIHYYPYGQNRGCSKSQNEGVYLAFTRYGCDVVLGICQDVYYNTLEAFDNWIEQCKQYIDTHYIISNRDSFLPNYAPFACWLGTPLLFENYGCMDENFIPTQYEDLDLARRCSFIKSGQMEDFWNNSYRIDIPSDSTHLTMLSRTDPLLLRQQLNITFPLNEQYYIKKWGGIGGHERFIYPFNNPELSYKIEWENRQTPYGHQYDRTDHDIVKY